jgi:hypothetical protein
MALVINKTTFAVIASGNTPDYSEDDWLINPDLSSVAGVEQKYWKVAGGQVVEMNTGEKAVVNAINSQLYIESVIRNSITFGSKLITQFAAENVLLGITQAGMTSAVRQHMGEVISALQTGSLYEAIANAKAVPSGNKDATFITDVRILSFVNKIESYLGITLSTSL